MALTGFDLVARATEARQILATFASDFAANRIRLIVQVAARAVRGMCSVSWFYGHVLFRGYWVEMVGPYAARIATHVMQMLAVWDLADEVRVHQTVSLPTATGVPHRAVLLRLGSVLMANGACPQATFTERLREAFVDFIDRRRVSHSLNYIASLPRGVW